MISNANKQKPNSQLLFNRSYQFTLGQLDDLNAIQFQNFWSKDQWGNDVAPSPMKITFDIEKNFVGSPNTTKFEIYNLALETRSKIRAGHILELKAGYNGLMDRIFFGQVGISSAKTVRSGPDMVTTIECYDGGAALAMCRIHKSYPPGVRLYQILQDVVAEMANTSDYNPVPIESNLTINLPNISFPRGKTVSGTCKSILDELLKGQGLVWSIQNNTLIIVPLNTPTNTSAIEIGPSTGMIGVPTKCDGYFEFKALLDPRLQPGVFTSIKTKEYYYDFNSQSNKPLEGFYQLRKVKYHGDTYGPDWSATCQCWEVNAQELVEPKVVSVGPDLSKAVSVAPTPIIIQTIDSNAQVVA